VKGERGLSLADPEFGSIDQEPRAIAEGREEDVRIRGVTASRSLSGTGMEAGRE
jgi:hypothetical protein